MENNLDIQATLSGKSFIENRIETTYNVLYNEEDNQYVEVLSCPLRIGRIIKLIDNDYINKVLINLRTRHKKDLSNNITKISIYEDKYGYKIEFHKAKNNESIKLIHVNNNLLIVGDKLVCHKDVEKLDAAMDYVIEKILN